MKTLFKHLCLATGLFLGASSSLWAQNALSTSVQQAFQQEEVVLMALVDSFRNSPIPDERLGFGMTFIKKLKAVIEMDNSYAYKFDSLKTKMHIIVAPDNSFRIFNWLISPSAYTKNYFGAIQLAGESKVIPLLDYSDQLQDQNREQEVVGNQQWYGCEYYNILQDEVQGQPIYLLFGYNSNSTNINRKLVDVLRFDNGKPVFGAPIFEAPNHLGQVVNMNRFIQSYKKNVTTSLNYDAKIKMIVFNRLESDISTPSRKDTYVPAGPIDGLQKNGYKWVYAPEIFQILKLKDGEAPIDGVLNNR